VYGLGNFCFGGNSNPASYDTMIWQQTFTFTADGLESEDDISIIPCRISGDTSSNNYQPVPVSGDAAASIMQTIDSLSASFGQSYSRYMVTEHCGRSPERLSGSLCNMTNCIGK
jgi:poly-gamma-glutamate synthesis protein (capsule biosynthesis protein)